MPKKKISMPKKKISFSVNGGGAYSKNIKGPVTVTKKHIGGSAAAKLMTGKSESITTTIKGGAYSGKFSAPDTLQKWKGGGVTGGKVELKTKKWDVGAEVDRVPSGRGVRALLTGKLRFNIGDILGE